VIAEGLFWRRRRTAAPNLVQLAAPSFVVAQSGRGAFDVMIAGLTTRLVVK
jgi:hypothetical protein